MKVLSPLGTALAKVSVNNGYRPAKCISKSKPAAVDLRRRSPANPGRNDPGPFEAQTGRAHDRTGPGLAGNGRARRHGPAGAWRGAACARAGALDPSDLPRPCSEHPRAARFGGDIRHDPGGAEQPGRGTGGVQCGMATQSRPGRTDQLESAAPVSTAKPGGYGG